jgi:hypothetical protein
MFRMADYIYKGDNRFLDLMQARNDRDFRKVS